MRDDLQHVLLVFAVFGFLGCAIGLWVDPKAMLASYLAAWFTVSSIPIGALGVLFISYLVRAGWIRDLHEPLSGAALTLPLMALLFVPVLIGLGWLYPWAADASTLPTFKAIYLAPWFFVLRSMIYFAIWVTLAHWGRMSYGNDAAMTRAASVGLIVWAITSSFAGIDWLESVQPQFHSSIYGLLSMSFQLLAAYAFGLTVIFAARFPQQMSTAAYGNLLQSILLFWVYLHAMQYIIIWSGNLPEEVVWYTTRLESGWSVALWILFSGQSILPFFALLSAKIRSSANALLWLAAMTLTFRYLEAIVLIVPPLDVNAAALFFDLPAALMAIAAGWLVAWQHSLRIWDRWSGRAGLTAQR